MENGRILLSLCIPTYNRSSVLDNAIQSIVSQEIYSNNDIEIVVCDNASTDDTEAVVRKYREKYPNIRYFKNDVNVRDFNFPTVLNHARGEFRKLMNDTLILKEYALENLYNAIRLFSVSRPIILFKNDNNDNNKIENRNNLIYRHTESREEALKAISFRMNWIGTLGIWKEDLAKIDTTEKHCETKLWQVEAILESMQHKDSYVIIGNEWFLTQTQFRKNVDYHFFTIFYTNYVGICRRNAIQLGLANRTIEWLRRDLLYNFFAKFIIESKYSVLNNDNTETRKMLFSELKKVYNPLELLTYEVMILNYFLKYHVKKLDVIGNTRRKIQALLGISEDTSIKKHLKRLIFRKFS